MKKTLFVAGLVILFGTSLVLAQRRGPKPSGPLAVSTLQFRSLLDAKRGHRSVPIKVHLPEGEGRHPLVIFSHGGGGSWDAFLYQAEDMASHGYVVLSVEHVRSNNKTLKADAREARGDFRSRFHQALQKMTTDPRAVLERPRDISFAIDRAISWNRDHPQLRGRIDTSKIAVVGHSFGAYTILAVCGARPIVDYLKPTVSPGKGLTESLADPRVTVGVAMSPQGPGTSRFSEESYATIDRPLLCFSGTQDLQFGYDGTTQPAKTRLEAFELMPKGDKYFAWLKNADHLSFADNPRAFLLPSESRVDAQRFTKTLTLAFCDAYLKGDAQAKQKLTQPFASSLCGEVITEVTWLRK